MASAGPPPPSGQDPILLRARSLRNALGVMRHNVEALRADLAHTKEDVAHYEALLAELKLEHEEMLAEAEVRHPKLATYNAHQLATCTGLVDSLRNSTVEMPDNLKAVHRRLGDVTHALQQLAARPHSSEEAAALQAQLDQADADRIVAADAAADLEKGTLAGQHMCEKLVDQAYELLGDCLLTAEPQPGDPQQTCYALRTIKDELRRAVAKKGHHSLEDVEDFQQRLDAIVIGEEPAGDWHLQAAHDIQDTAYDLLDRLRQLATPMPAEMRRTLHALRRHHARLQGALHRPHTLPELRHIQGQLDEIDDARQQAGGVFARDPETSDVPRGQAQVSELLHQCYKLVRRLYRDAIDTGPVEGEMLAHHSAHHSLG